MIIPTTFSTLKHMKLVVNFFQFYEFMKTNTLLISNLIITNYRYKWVQTTKILGN